MLSRRVVLLLGLCFGMVASPISAQTRISTRTEFYLGVNILVGGTTGAIRALLHETPVVPAVLKGMAGGGVIYGGQRLIGTGRDELRFAGVQTVALGSNLVRNASSDAGWLSDITIPIFPFLVRYQTVDSILPRLGVRVSAGGVVGIAQQMIDHGDVASFDLKESLLAGAPVFVSDSSFLRCMWRGCGLYLNGQHMFGATTVAKGHPDFDRIRAHEMQHLAQFIRDDVIFGVPMSDYALRHFDEEWGLRGRPLTRMSRFIVLDAFLPLGSINAWSEFLTDTKIDNFYEREAEALVGGDLCRNRSERSCRRW